MSFQGEELAAWLRQRAGKLTASRMRDAMNFNKNGKPSADRLTYMKELLAERLTGDSVRHFVTSAMQWGLDHEDDAKAAYEAETGNLILDVGFFDHPTIDNFGGTPDGRIDDGLIEVKCPTSVTHVEWMMEGVVPEEHRPQMIANLMCTGESVCDFVSYDPRMRNPRHRLFIVQFAPSPEALAEVEAAAKKFLAELEIMWELFHAGNP